MSTIFGSGFIGGLVDGVNDAIVSVYNPRRTLANPLGTGGNLESTDSGGKVTRSQLRSASKFNDIDNAPTAIAQLLEQGQLSYLRTVDSEGKIGLDRANHNDFAGNYNYLNPAGYSLEAVLNSMGVTYDKLLSRILMTEKINKNRVVQPNDFIGYGKKYIFFTKPDMYFFTKGGKINPSIQQNCPDLYMKIMRYPHIARLLQSDISGKTAIGPGHGFIHLLGNYCVNLNYQEMQLSMREANVNIKGYGIKYGGDFLESMKNTDVSIQFVDNRNRDLTAMIEIWTEYIEGVSQGKIYKKRVYRDNNTLDYAISIYIISLDETNTIVSHGALVGCYPVTVPVTNLNYTNETVPGTTYMGPHNVMWQASHVLKPNTHQAVEMFNYTSGFKYMKHYADKNTERSADHYNASYKYVYKTTFNSIAPGAENQKFIMHQSMQPFGYDIVRGGAKNVYTDAVSATMNTQLSINEYFPETAGIVMHPSTSGVLEYHLIFLSREKWLTLRGVPDLDWAIYTNEKDGKRTYLKQGPPGLVEETTDSNGNKKYVYNEKAFMETKLTVDMFKFSVWQQAMALQKAYRVVDSHGNVDMLKPGYGMGSTVYSNDRETKTGKGVTVPAFDEVGTSVEDAIKAENERIKKEKEKQMQNAAGNNGQQGEDGTRIEDNDTNEPFVVLHNKMIADGYVYVGKKNGYHEYRKKTPAEEEKGKGSRIVINPISGQTYEETTFENVANTNNVNVTPNVDLGAVTNAYNNDKDNDMSNVERIHYNQVYDYKVREKVKEGYLDALKNSIEGAREVKVENDNVYVSLNNDPNAKYNLGNYNELVNNYVNDTRLPKRIEDNDGTSKVIYEVDRSLHGTAAVSADIYMHDNFSRWAPKSYNTPRTTSDGKITFDRTRNHKYTNDQINFGKKLDTLTNREELSVYDINLSGDKKLFQNYSHDYIIDKGGKKFVYNKTKHSYTVAKDNPYGDENVGGDKVTAEELVDRLGLNTD